jgi:hypothetical protein
VKLSRTIPAYTETLSAIWCKRDYSKFTESWREARRVLKNPMDACFWCGHKFNDGEIIGLACFQDKGNKVLCVSCADRLLASEPVSV